MRVEEDEFTVMPSRIVEACGRRRPTFFQSIAGAPRQEFAFPLYCPCRHFPIAEPDARANADDRPEFSEDQF